MISQPETKPNAVSCSGTCPFGTSCFYAHRYPDGTVEDRRVRTAVDSDGHYDVLRQVRLEHFLQQDK